MKTQLLRGQGRLRKRTMPNGDGGGYSPWMPLDYVLKSLEADKVLLFDDEGNRLGVKNSISAFLKQILREGGEFRLGRKTGQVWIRLWLNEENYRKMLARKD